LPGQDNTGDKPTLNKPVKVSVYSTCHKTTDVKNLDPKKKKPEIGFL